MADTHEYTYRLVTMTPAPPGLCRVRTFTDRELSYAQEERIVMVAGVQITDASGDTWPTAFLLTADELAAGIVDDCLDGSLDLGDIVFYTCADDDTLSVRVHGAAGRLRDSLTQEHSGRWRIGDCVDFPPGRSRAKSRG